MKKKVIFMVVAIIIASTSCQRTKETKEIVHQRFVVCANFSFEVLSGPDQNGEMDIMVTNLHYKDFGYREILNDIDAPVPIGNQNIKTFPKSYKQPQRIITINKTSGLNILENEDAYFIFESASNFFSIY